MNNSKRILSYYGVECSSNSFTDTHLVSSDRQVKLSTIWLSRLKLINKYLHGGIDVLLTDSDALWLRDPFPDIAYHTTYFNKTADIVAQKGFAPWDLSEKWGACLCFGFIYIKSSRFNIDLFQEIDTSLSGELKIAAKSKTNFKVDDQHAINKQLFAWDVKWPSKMLIAGTAVDTGSVERNNVTSYITLLSHDKYVRYCLEPGSYWVANTKAQHLYVKKKLENATIAHCQVASGNDASKVVFLRLHGLWKHTFQNWSGILPNKLDAALDDPFFQEKVEEYADNYGESFQLIISNYGNLQKQLSQESLRVAQLREEQKAVIYKQSVIASGGNWTGQILPASYSSKKYDIKREKNAVALARLRETLAKNRAAHAELKAHWDRRHSSQKKIQLSTTDSVDTKPGNVVEMYEQEQ